MSDAIPILHMFSPQKHMSPFDVNMAADAGYKVIVPYINVELSEVTGLIQDAIFSRPPNYGVRTGFFMGGKDANGRYDVAKDWYLKYGVGFAFKSLEQDPDIIAAQKKAGYDLDILRQQFATAQVRENVLTTWYAEWDRYMQQQIQNVLLRQIKPADAMAASAKKAQELKKNAS